MFIAGIVAITKHILRLLMTDLFDECSCRQFSVICPTQFQWDLNLANAWSTWVPETKPSDHGTNFLSSVHDVGLQQHQAIHISDNQTPHSSIAKSVLHQTLLYIRWTDWNLCNECSFATFSLKESAQKFSIFS